MINQMILNFPKINTITLRLNQKLEEPEDFNKIKSGLNRDQAKTEAGETRSELRINQGLTRTELGLKL